MNLNKSNYLHYKYQQIRTMYRFVQISQITKQNVNEKLNIKGWIKGHRNMKSNIFLDINDGSCHNPLQIVINKKNNENHKELHIGYGASIDVSGILKETPKGQLELNANNYNVIGKCTLSDGYPFVPKQQHTAEYTREYLNLRSRYHVISSILRVRHMAINTFNNYLHNNGYFNIHTPVITTNDCEGAGETFTIQPDNHNLLKQMQKDGVELTESFFDKKVYLSVSGQLHLESMCYGLGNVYSFGPTFRAENSKSPVHLTEFYMLELEQSFIQSLSELCSITERMIKQVTETLLNTSIVDIENIRSIYGGSINNDHNKKQTDIANAFQWLQKPFVHLTYQEALDILEKHNKLNNINKNNISANGTESIPPAAAAAAGGLTKEQELFLVNYTDKCPIFLIDWPMKMKPFYMRQKSNNLNLVEAFDLLVPTIGELIGGSVREDNFERLKEKLPSKDLNWYLELRKFGGITTGGFGMGFERYLQLLLNVTNIKDCIPFPRWPHNCSL